MELKNWILSGQLVLTDEKDPEFNRWHFEDYRNEQDRQSRLWEVVERDEKTGSVRVMSNTMMDKDGNFVQSPKPDGSWFKRLFKR